MDLFLLLTALIASLTGTVRTVIVRAPETVVVRQFADGGIDARVLAVKAWSSARSRPVAMHPEGDWRIDVPARPVAIALPGVVSSPCAPERRRE